MDGIKHMIALDCGNSSIRVVLGKYDGTKITTEVISQTPNDMVKIHDYYYWDFLKIYDILIKSIKEVLKSIGRIDSIGVCTWGVDFSLYDYEGNLLSNPLSYRNKMGEDYLNQLSEEKRRELFMETGILCDKINSLYLLNGIKHKMPEIYKSADKLLMIPDMINYMLTKVMINEPSELSTSQIMSARTRSISKKVCAEFGIRTNLFCTIGKHGQAIGNLTPSIKEELEIDYDIPVICVPSHDTAAAVVAIPTTEKEFAFISSGTWALIGTELMEPVINDKVIQYGLTNEVGAFDKITLLKNSAGMFLLQRIKKEFDVHMGEDSSWETLNQLAEKYKGYPPLFDVNCNRFFNPLHMGQEIWNFLCETNQVKGQIDWSILVKAVQESIACNFAITIKGIEDIIGKTFHSIYIVGGGSKNEAVNELTAKITGKQIVACSKESTSLGNIATQIVQFHENYTLEDIRKILIQSVECKTYNAQTEGEEILERYQKLLDCIE
jgi:sugar (pentulose or hexulose) kinase